MGEAEIIIRLMVIAIPLRGRNKCVVSRFHRDPRNDQHHENTLVMEKAEIIIRLPVIARSPAELGDDAIPLINLE